VSKYRNKSKITEIIIHCAATPNGKRFTATDIDNWHKERGFKRGDAFVGRNDLLHHIGYHFVIDIDGEITEGRKLDETGAHAKGHNFNSVGICLIGMDKFTNEQWIKLGELIRKGVNNFPGIKIIGHNEISKKDCPCFDVQRYMNGGMLPLPENIL